MILSEVAGVPQAALPIQGLRDHLKLGTGFADDAVQDTLLETCVRAALAVIERRTGKALVARAFRLVLQEWREADGQALPIAPVTAVSSVTLRDASGATIPLPLSSFRLVEDLQRPRIAAAGSSLPSIPQGGDVAILLTAGFGPLWSDIPADLAQATMLLAAHYHENRHADAVKGTEIPFGIVALIERWRTVRILGGAFR